MKIGDKVRLKNPNKIDYEFPIMTVTEFIDISMPGLFETGTQIPLIFHFCRTEWHAPWVDFHGVTQPNNFGCYNISDLEIMP